MIIKFIKYQSGDSTSSAHCSLQVRFLIGLGTDVNAPGTERALDYRAEATPLIVCARVRGSHWGVGLAQNLLEAGAFVGRVDRLGMNALHHACIYGRYKLVRADCRALRALLLPIEIVYVMFG